MVREKKFLITFTFYFLFALNQVEEVQPKITNWVFHFGFIKC